jgi:CRISPR-associated protein Cmr3
MCEMLSVFFEPLDCTFFRTPRPFTAAEVLAAESTFPLPQAVYGAIRSMLLLDPVHGCKALATFGQGDCDRDGRCEYSGQCRIPALIGTPDRPGRIRVRGPILGRREAGERIEPWYPAPRVIVHAGSALDILQPAQFAGEDPFGDFETDDLGLAMLFAGRSGDFERFGDEDLVISGAGLARLLGGEALRADELRPTWDLFRPEPRVGVALRGAERTVKPSHLYMAKYHRLTPGTGFLVQVEGLDYGDASSWPQAAFLGGERRAAAVEAGVNAGRWPPAPEITGGRLRLCLLTPAILGGGWVPWWLAASRGWTAEPVSLPGRYGVDAKVRLVAATVGRPAAVGGYQFALVKKNGRNRQRGPRPIRLAAPAGSTYDIKVTEGDPAEVASAIREHGLSDCEAEAGFGVTAVGCWNPVEIGGTS